MHYGFFKDFKKYLFMFKQITSKMSFFKSFSMATQNNNIPGVFGIDEFKFD